MHPGAQFLLAREFPLLEKIGAKSTYNAFEKVSENLYRLFWSDVSSEHFILDSTFLVAALILISIVVSVRKGPLMKNVASAFLRAGRVFACFWTGSAALCLAFAAADLPRLPLGRDVMAFWMAVLFLCGASLIWLFVACLRTTSCRFLGPSPRMSAALKAAGVIIAAFCASSLFFIELPPQTALGWLVAQLCILGIPAGVGLLLPFRQEIATDGGTKEAETLGPRYFKRWDFVLLIPVLFLLLNSPHIPTLTTLGIVTALGENDLMPLLLAVILAICLFNRVTEKELRERPRSLFANVFSAFLIVQISLMFYPASVWFSLFIAFLAYLVLGLRVQSDIESASRPLWRRARFWVAIAAGGLVLRQAYITAHFMSVAFNIPHYAAHHKMWPAILSVVLTVVLGLGSISLILFIFRKRDVRRPIRYAASGLLLAMCALAVYPGEKRGFTLGALPSLKFGVMLTLVLLLVLLRYEKAALGFGRLLRGRPTRMVIYALLFAFAVINRGVTSFPSCASGCLYFATSGLSENDGVALRSLPTESIAAAEFLRRSIFDSPTTSSPSEAPETAEAASIHAWSGIMPIPLQFPKLGRTSFLPKILGRPAQLIAGAARVESRPEAPGVVLQVLYSRRIPSVNLSEHLEMQLRPGRARRTASQHLDALKRPDGWAAFYDCPYAILQLNGPWRQWNTRLEAVIECAIFSLLDPPGHEALKQFWRLDGMPGVMIY